VKTIPTIAREPFGVTTDGSAVELFTLDNGSGAMMRVMTYGAAIVSLQVPDRDGALDDVVLGYDTLDEYLHDSFYLGSAIGRYGNRIARGHFVLDGVEYALVTNDGENHLHGGKHGFDKHVWRATPAPSPEGASVAFALVSADGDEGYPGRLDAEVRYTLSAGAEVIVDYRATTDRATVVNLTQHSYFNLAASRSADVLGHELTLSSGRFLPVSPALIPTGVIASVENTPFDFRAATPLGARIDEPHEQLRIGRGYDHTFVLDRSDVTLARAAHVFEPLTGRTLDVWTTEPGVQLYSGNFLNGRAGRGGRRYDRRAGFCLETQHFPDSPNQPAFPSTTLRPGQQYRSRTVFAFGARSRA
jgi:aldose 1-epimerase